MRLLTHNMLQCPRTRAYPLELEIETCDEVVVEYSAAFIRRMLPRVNWEVFLAAAKQIPDAELVGMLPAAAPGDEAADDGDVLKAVHRALLQWHVVDGKLSADGVRYTVSNGIPNLVITEVRKEDAKEDGEDGEDEVMQDDGKSAE